MKIRRRVAEFTDRFPLLGPLVWALSIQYFVAQAVVAHAWHTPFSLRHNVISDLGNTACGLYVQRYVCSPQHGLMNASFVLLGLTMAIGSLLVYQEFTRSRVSRVGFLLMASGGIGTVLVGLFPENTLKSLHGLGAALTFGLGNLSLVVLAVALRHVRFSFRVYTFISGIVALVAFVLFIAHQYLGLDQGGMERLVSYPQTLWLTLFGLYMSATRLRARQAQKPLPNKLTIDKNKKA